METVKYKEVSDLYFECHVTIEPVFGERLKLAQDLSRNHKFKVAELLMKKRDSHDEFEPSDYDTFTTGHSKYYSDIRDRMIALIENLKNNEFKILRYKIEDTVCDSKRSDYLGVLNS